MGRSSRRQRREKEEHDDSDDNEDEQAYTYTLMPDTKSPFSCCCICYRYLLDICMVLALAPFVVNCILEAIIHLITFDWKNITWGKSILAILAVSIWFGLAAFGVLCCIAVMRKGVFTRRLRQKRKDEDEAERLAKSQSEIAETPDDAMA
ncbi:expressed unknown protein [Seminavis robusta]|uniref:Uncharacterized protein n=1 Tax=Seminavis robusta TaxID=568900 RepID=A0A9N8DCE4_9STRA|nr:expressed unknown protein [Seminavis robusta]|eukprot:Sro58_g033940.1 n/a (150) ;mRNA; f:141962-142411